MDMWKSKNKKSLSYDLEKKERITQDYKIEISPQLLDLMPDLKEQLVKSEVDIKITLSQVLKMLWNAFIVYTKYKSKSFNGLSGYSLAISVAAFLLQKLADYKEEK